jgi:CBS domain-containing protein
VTESGKTIGRTSESNAERMAALEPRHGPLTVVPGIARPRQAVVRSTPCRGAWLSVAVVVAREDKPVGVLTRSDLLEYLAHSRG